MIMLITYRSELRDQLNTMLQAKGHETCIPPHRQDVIAVMEDCHPDLIVIGYDDPEFAEHLALSSGPFRPPSCRGDRSVA